MSAKRKSKTRKWIAISIITIAAVVTAATLLLRPAPTPYESVNAENGDITTYYSFSGNVKTKNRQTVLAEKVMQISAINFKAGDTVKEGDVLIKTTTGDVIKSKINGVVTNVNVEENAQVMASVKLLEIVDNNNLEIIVKVDEYDIAALAIGKETIVKIGALNKEIKGKVMKISEEGQTVNGVTFFTATIDLVKDSSLKIGMSAEVKLISEKVTGVVTLPLSAIQFDDNNKPYVLKKDDKGATVKTEISTGINDGTKVEVKSGVSNEETVLHPKALAAGGMDFRRNGPNRSNANGGEI